jgi:glycosidase
MPDAKTPDWVKDAIFYQIFPDRFAFSKALQPVKPDNLEPWDSPPTTYGYKGGDLIGVVERLDYLQDLGINALYFNPIFQSASNHRYHTHDYYQVDPLLGGNQAFTTLLEAAQRRGIRVILDGVFNHASRGFFYFNDIVENGRSSPYLDWFTISEFPVNPYDLSRIPGYRAWYNLHALPKFNTDHPQVREYLMRVAEHWTRMGIDGWRLDVPNEIQTGGFWEEFRQRVKEINPDAYITGEIWQEAGSYLQGDRFDGVMNYLFAEAAISFAAGPRVDWRLAEGKGYRPSMNLDARSYADRIDWVLSLYPWEIQLAQFNLLDSHDTARVISLAGGDIASVHLSTLLLMTYPGAVSIYYGDEIGLEGGMPDHDTRRPFPWDRPHLWKTEVLDFHKELIRLRNRHPALRRGIYRRLYADDAVYAFGRQLGEETLLIAVNTAGQSRTAAIPVDGFFAPDSALEMLYGSSGGADIQAGKVQLNLSPRSGVVLKVLFARN